MIGSRIATLRHNLGLTQSALAEQLNISSSALGMYEQGRREPPLDIVVALSQKFEVTIDYLLTGQLCSANDFSVLSKLLANNIYNVLRLNMFTKDDLILLFTASLMKE